MNYKILPREVSCTPPHASSKVTFCMTIVYYQHQETDLNTIGLNKMLDLTQISAVLYTLTFFVCLFEFMYYSTGVLSPIHIHIPASTIKITARIC